VGTPSERSGQVDESALTRVVEELARARAEAGRVIPILVRSTALPPVHRRLMELVGRTAPDQPLAYCVHPEFLRAGKGVADFLDPPKIVFGPSDQPAREACRLLYPGFAQEPIYTDPMTAAMVKYADNCFHAVKVTFANEMGQVCHSLGVDPRRVMDIFCQDTRLNLSPYYLKPGFAFGGSCLPKDLRAVVSHSRLQDLRLPMLDHVLESNRLQVEEAARRILDSGVRRVGLFGLAFKENTDDLRESPLVALAERLTGKGVRLGIYDPHLSMSRMVGANRVFALSALPHLAELLEDDPAAVVAASGLVVVARAFPRLDWGSLPWREDHLVLELAEGGDLSGVGGRRQGLYW
jgi:GDP-mannose 6-dehydrogenase